MRLFLVLLLSLKFLFAFGFVNSAKPTIVPVEKAYKVEAKQEGDEAILRLQMVDKVYVYKKYLKLSLNGKEVQLPLPKPMQIHGEEVYEGNLTLRIPLPKAPKVVAKLSFQGCNEAGICYPPQTRTFTFHPAIKKTATQPKSAAQPVSESQSIANTLRHKSLAVILATFFGFGLLLALTPCIFPMIPILSSLIVGAKNMNTKKAFFYSLVYVLAMSVTYTIAGVLAGLFGANLQAALQNPVVITLFALIFVALAFSMFGFYEIGLPASWQTAIAKRSDAAGSKGGLIGVAIMGFLSALIVGPCVAPPLAGALIYIGQTGDALLGGLALFAMSLGMGAPLLLVGVGAGKFMPKPGGWMEAVSNVFGVVMLGLAIWMLERILPSGVTMFLWGALFVGSAVYLRALEPISEGAHWWNYFKKSLGIILLIYGVFVLIGAFKGASTPLKPFGWQGGASESAQPRRALFQKIDSLKELQQILATPGKPVLVDVTAKWCASCKELEENTFSDPRVQKALAQFRALRLDMSDNSASDKEFLRHFGLYGPPAILFFDANGKEIRSLRIIGYKDPESFLQILNQAYRSAQ